MSWQSNHPKRNQAQNSHRLLNPEPFLCQCVNKPEVKKTQHPSSGKHGYYVVLCRYCGNHSIYAKELYKSVLDWNMKSISQDPDHLAYPGMKLDHLNLNDALDEVREEKDRIDMLIKDKERAQLEASQWQLLKARHGWCQMLIAVGKRRIKLLEKQFNVV